MDHTLYNFPKLTKTHLSCYKWPNAFFEIDSKQMGIRESAFMPHAKDVTHVAVSRKERKIFFRTKFY